MTGRVKPWTCPKALRDDETCNEMPALGATLPSGVVSEFAQRLPPKRPKRRKSGELAYETGARSAIDGFKGAIGSVVDGVELHPEAQRQIAIRR